MAWVTLTTTDALAAFAAVEKAKYDAISADDKLADILAGVVQEIRGYVASKYPLETGATIPPELQSVAIALTRYRFLNSLPTKRLLTDERIAENRDALARLREVASGKFAITSDGGIISGNPATLISQRASSVTGAKLKGF